jgi:SprB repeat
MFMKKSITFKIVSVLVLFIAVFQFACKHELPPPSCNGSYFKVTATQTPATLNQNNGSITATASGGAGFQFSLNGSAYQDSGYFSGLEPFKNYNLVGKNSIGCTDTVVVQIGSFDPCQGVVINVTLTKTDASVNQSNGSVTATATGGTGFTYSINGGAFQTSGTFSNLAAGNYVVAAKSITGCIGSNQVTVGTNNPCAGITVAITNTVVQPTAGQSNGAITATATGGTGFTYSLNNGAFQASGTFSGLAAGNYNITAKNSNGCTGVTTVALGASNPCAGITVAVTTTTVNPSTGLSNGSITASATGGTGFTYSLNSGAYQASGTFANLAAGTYTITAKNSNGCLGSTQATLTATSPCTSTTIVLTAAIVNTTPCVTPTNNGSITVTATGSTGFTYNINGGAYQASNVFASQNAGNYVMGVKDVNGCTKTLSVTVAVVAQGPLFAQVRNLITTRCSGSGCHMNGGTAAGYNFDADCNIVAKWSQINSTSVLYSAGWVKMPKSPQSLLTAAEKAIITNWINAGHKYTD